jgi:ribosomal protein S18 acetylase RimI-like enzyme
MAEGFTLRRLGEGDLAEYKALRDEMLAAQPEAFTSDAQATSREPASVYFKRFGLDGTDPARFTIGAFDGAGALIGTMACDRDRRAKVLHVAQLIGMMVRPQARRQGVGAALLQACIAEARRVPELEMLTLSVTASNVAAVRLYTRAGFERYGRLPRATRTDAGYHDKDLMLLRL